MRPRLNPVRVMSRPQSWYRLRLIVNYIQRVRNAFRDSQIVLEVGESQLRPTEPYASFFQVIDCILAGLRAQSFFHEIDSDDRSVVK